MTTFTGATFFNQSPVLQNKYRARIRSQVHTRSRVYNMIPTMDTLTGSKLVGALRVGLPGGGGARGPSATLPVPVRTPHENYRVTATWHYYKIRADWDIEEQSRGNSWMRTMAIEQEAVREMISQHMERQSCRNGSAKLATISSISGSTITVSTKWDLAAMYPGMRIDVVDSVTSNATSQLTGLTTESAYPVVISVDPGGPTLELNKAPTGAAASDVIITYGALSLGTGNGDTRTNEFYGIDALIDDDAPVLLPTSNEPGEAVGTLQGINPTQKGYWRSQVVTASSQTLAPTLIEDGIYNVQVFGADSSDGLTYLFCHPKQEQNYAQNIRADKLSGEASATGSLLRYPGGGSGDGHKLEASWQGVRSERQYMQYGGIVFVTSKYFDTTRAYVCPQSCIGKINVYDWNYVSDPNGGVVHKAYNDNAAAWEAELMYIGALATELRNSAIRIESLTAPAG